MTGWGLKVSFWAALGVPAGLLASAILGAQPPSGPLGQVNAALQAGEADSALLQLGSLPAPIAGSAEAANMECRVRITLEQWDAASGKCEQAVKLDPQNSVYHVWLGRTLGERASRASFMNAYSLAKRVRAEFEEAVRLNPRNVDALEDLGQFYQEAPGVIGGGADKAEAVAVQLEKLDMAKAHELRARIAGGHKDYTTAEIELRQAIQASPRPAQQWVALAGFYCDRQRWSEMLSAVHSATSAAERDKHSAVALFDGASVLIKANREPAMAARMLEAYLVSPFKSEEAPAFVAHLRLAKLKQQLGDSAAASREQSAAQALARDYKESQEPKH